MAAKLRREGVIWGLNGAAQKPKEYTMKTPHQVARGFYL